MADAWPLLFLALVVAALVVRARYRRITIFEYQRGLRYRKGRFVALLGPGQHWLYKPNTHAAVLDVRPRFVSVSGQEVLTTDGVTVKVSLAARYEISDPARAVNAVEDYHEGLYLVLQMGLREIISTTTADDLLEKRDQIGPRLLELAAPRVQELGLKLLLVDVKDLMFPGELKKLFSNVVRARKEGQAALERARGEAAALRSLANAARMVAEHPGLLQLRALQSLADGAGNTIVFGLPAETVAARPAAKVEKPDEPKSASEE